MTSDPTITPGCTCPWMDGMQHYEPRCYEHGLWPELEAPSGLADVDLKAAMAEPNPHGGCPDAGCGPECPARIDRPETARMVVFGSADDATDWAAYGRTAFIQNWRKRAERAEAELERLRRRQADRDT